jgi:pilus assembly protein FimV
VKGGDSLSRIASKTQRPGVSLDQMLVSLFRANPQAFVGDNMNRLKSGAVLTVPSAEAVRKVTPGEARDVIQAQSADFSSYRQRLAGGVTTQADEGPARQAKGSVQARVEDRKQAGATSPDKLTLSQGTAKAAGAEAKISKDAERKDTSTRVAELSRNVEDLKRLQQGAVPPAPATTPPVTPPAPPAKPAVPPAAAPAQVAAPPAPPPAPAPVPSPAPVAAPVPPAAPAPASPTVASAPALPVPTVSASAPGPKPAAPAPQAKPPAPPAEEPGFLASLLDNPYALPGAGGLLALLIGLGVYRARSRKKAGGETSFLESRLQPDSFFGASGGQRIDTRDAASSTSAAASSSMSYSLSQLDAIGDVDPVAEADVYLAYGRDLQAEEILKEAMRANPQRMAIRTKLLEVYAKRRDIKGFELLAAQVHSLTHGVGEDWDKIQEMGQQVDPTNPLYQPGGQPEPVHGAGGQEVPEPLGASTMPHTASVPPQVFTPEPGPDSRPGDLDLDLDLGSEPPMAPGEVTRAMQTRADIALEPTLDFEPPTLRDAGSTQPAAMMATPPSMGDGGLDFDLDSLQIEEPVPKTMPLPRADVGDKALDFGDFNLQPPEVKTIAMGRAPVAAPKAQADDVPPIDEAGDPLARKLELAEEFRQIGDVEGARDLIEEVIAKADGVLKSKAQVMLDGLA